MRVLITENKMVKIYQSLIDKCVSELVNIDGVDNIPVWVDPMVLDDFDTIDTIKVTDVETYNEEYPAFKIYIINIRVDVVLDSIRLIDLDNLRFHLEYYIKTRLFGKDRSVRVNILMDNVDLKNKNPQW